jgi:hypothetical protein
VRLSALFFVALLIPAHAGQAATVTLEGFASLPADTLMPGPVSGQHIEAEDGIILPFSGQPVQGFSAIIPNNDGSYLVLADNGFGNRQNSPDFLLRIYCIEPDFRSSLGGSGNIVIDGYINLSDPNHISPYRSIHAGEASNAMGAAPEPPEYIAEGQLLTGADFDPESLQRQADGSFWVGDELGPFLLHLNSRGELLDRPFVLKGLAAPNRPALSTGAVVSGSPIPEVIKAPVMKRSKGFESMAMSPSGTKLYPMLEGALLAQPDQLNIYEFDLESRAYLNDSATEPSYRYRLDPGATAVGAFKLFSETSGLVLERDSGQAGEAKHKKVFRVDFDRIDKNGFLEKQEIADLLHIDDPLDLNADGSTTFDFPFHTPEGLLVMDKNTIGIISDNNYPFGRGRGPDAGPEPTEFILITVGDLW